MKKLITLSLISLISITHAFSKSFNNNILSNNCKGKTLFTPADLKHGNALVKFTIQKAGKGTLVVIDESGITVLKQPLMLVAGKNNQTINNISRLNEGNYTICVNTNYKTYSTAFVLWK